MAPSRYGMTQIPDRCPTLTPCWKFYPSGRAHARVPRSQACTCQCGLLQILRCRLAHHPLRPQPPTHIQHFRSTFIPHRKRGSRRIYLHAAHCCQRVTLCMMAIANQGSLRKEGFLHITSPLFLPSPFCSTTRKERGRTTAEIEVGK